MTRSSARSDTETHFSYPRLLTIAGSDSGGGAGIQADLKTFAALGCYGMSAITAITAQNTRGVRAIAPLAPSILTAQIDAVAEDIGVDAVKIGMLHDPETVRTVAAALRRHRFAHVVLDPVMVATSGDALMARETVAVLVSELFPLAAVVTPNLHEAALLLGRPVAEEADMEAAAAALLALGAQAVLLKGGHLPGERMVDLLARTGAKPQAMVSARIPSANTHGTGCTLSSALACHLALGASLDDAAQRAKDYVHAAIAAGADVRIGHGHGPLNHGFAPVAMRKVERSS
ncbi:bifunctional hydroxymethylpyrimidine kinase/phosphomethylpyrimidine kinase [Noviherbaspirillum pedocola]|uniref:hydroxymethylpyrimidine kinase n=1 Tax=Noviherbaspirillum pedocola TaxID=2801341 RepID=A0A934W8L7_9BURK|nr:bifunctional hydroxymethylpyrimidine kinase/phosphomethylpyrimidine kinase [Noviherbaspirillum pedocola]MBK4737725.1 bifunctional hydroxymethylpyrimidine kinase/phosphomethylpyrimidine kinase [Noviherbaspirillum pedocola]